MAQAKTTKTTKNRKNSKVQKPTKAVQPTRKTHKNSKRNLIIGICAILATLAIIAIIVIVIIKNQQQPIDDSFFVSDGSKYVLNLNVDEYSITFPDIANAAPKTIHTVYFYSGDKITGVTYYYEYNDEEAAKQAAETIRKLNDKTDQKSQDFTINGKYLVIKAPASVYESLTTNDVQQLIKYYENLLDQIKTKQDNENASANHDSADNKIKEDLNETFKDTKEDIDDAIDDLNNEIEDSNSTIEDFDDKVKDFIDKY